MGRETGTKAVIVVASSYIYHGRVYRKGEPIDMDDHDVARAVERKQVRLKSAPKPLGRASKGPSKTMATGPSENR